MVCCAVLSGMRIDIEHARALAHELVRFAFDPVGGDPGQTGGSDFHTALGRALATYSDNADTLTGTAREMGENALETLSVVRATDQDLSLRFTHQAGTLT